VWVSCAVCYVQVRSAAAGERAPLGVNVVARTIT
jgi:hypothetical protein